MKKIKVLYVGSTQVKNKKHYDGEVIKSQYILDILNKNCVVRHINLSHHKLFGALKILFFSLFSKYDYYIISKSPKGGNIILKIMRLMKVDSNKIFYCLIGSSLWMYFRDKSKKVKMENIKYTNRILVETQSIKDNLAKYDIINVDVVPNFRPNFHFPEVEKVYPKQVLRLCFFSRLTFNKGIVSLIEVIKKINSDGVKFQLDVFGRGNERCLKRVKELEDENIKYYGAVILKDSEDYAMISHYDIHCLPTKSLTEGMPGSIIDFFIAKVPTLSSLYPNYEEILDDSCAFLYEFDNELALKEKLLYIYDHQEEINIKRCEVIKRASLYYMDTFEKSLFKILKGDFYE